MTYVSEKLKRMRSVAYYLRLGIEKIKEFGTKMFGSLAELEWLVGVSWKYG